ncbi:MAG TPA: cupin domain-containing protein [Mycobacteriales bacterium]|nr:cupin domain-containing protein [Mycobacteriales bacterium]
MTPDVGTELINPKAGTKTVFLATAESTGGAYLEIEVTYPPNSTPPPMHKHPSQSEHFTVLAGAIDAVVDGIPSTVAAGQALDVPADTAHRMWATDDGVVMRWRTTPALRTGEMFCDLWAVARDNDWQPDGMAMFGVISKYDAEFCLC